MVDNFLEKAFGASGLAEVSDEIKNKYIALMESMNGQTEGFEEMESVWKPTIVKVTQAMSSSKAGKPENAKLGDLFHKGGLIKRPFNVCVVYAWPTRVRFAQGDEIPSCSSENVDLKGRDADDKSISIYGDKCSVCPYDDQPYRHGKSTSCNNVYNTLLFPEDLSGIYVMQFSKSAFTTGKQMIDLASARKPAWSRFFAIDSTVEKRKQGGGQYAVPQVSPLEIPVPKHTQDFCAMLSEHFKAYRNERKNMLIAKSTRIDETMDLDNLKVAKGGKSSGGKDFSDDAM